MNWRVSTRFSRKDMACLKEMEQTIISFCNVGFPLRFFKNIIVVP